MVGEGTPGRVERAGRRSFSEASRSCQTMRPLQRLLPRDPRDLQIAFLASFLVLGVAFLGLPIEPWMPSLLLASTCGVQWACERLLGLPSSGFRSPLITGLGLSLLLRTDAVWVPPLAATVAIGAKY